MSILPDWYSEPDKWLIAKNIAAKKLLKNPLLQKNLWRTVDDLGLKINQHDRILTINFRPIEQECLNLLSKLYILSKSQRNYSARYLKNEVGCLAKFSQFISLKSLVNPEQIDNQLFEEFDYYLHSYVNKITKKPLSERSISIHYTSLSNFFKLCHQEDWLEVNTYWFKGRYKKSEPKNDDIDYIPEEVWQQLDDNLHHLPQPLQRMILVLRATGLRIGELLNLSLNCLRKRGKQWRLRFLTEKYLVEDELPICEELVVIIQQQQEYIKKQFDNKYHNLFGSNESGSGYSYKPSPKIMQVETFNRWLNKLATEHNICNKKGEIWKFRSHQFRKTVATIMTNAGVRDLIIQKYLRHRSPEMQNYYKHLLKQVIGDEYQELMKETKYVDSTGKIVATYKPNNLITELMRRKMHQITTQYGECHRPILKSPCQTVNACWRCEHWLTSSNDLAALKNDLQRVQEELKNAEKLRMVRQQKELISDQAILIIRIQGLERENDKY